MPRGEPKTDVAQTMRSVVDQTIARSESDDATERSADTIYYDRRQHTADARPLTRGDTRTQGVAGLCPSTAISMT
jgi:hypothetical protein